MPYAVAADLKDRWQAFPPGLPDKVVDTLLEDAAVWLKAKFPLIPDAPSEQQAGVLKMVSCAMVRRSLIAETHDGASEITDTGGPFSSTLRFANGEGNFYLTGQERDLIENAIGVGEFRNITAEGW